MVALILPTYVLIQGDDWDGDEHFEKLQHGMVAASVNQILKRFTSQHPIPRKVQPDESSSKLSFQVVEPTLITQEYRSYQEMNLHYS